MQCWDQQNRGSNDDDGGGKGSLFQKAGVAREKACLHDLIRQHCLNENEGNRCALFLLDLGSSANVYYSCDP